MSTFPLKKPSPDFEAFEKVLKGEKNSRKGLLCRVSY